MEYILKQNQPADGNSLPFPEPNSPYQAQVNWIFTNVKFEEAKVSNFLGEVDETITFVGLCEKVTYQSVQVNAYHSVGMLSYRVVNESGDCVEFSYSGDKWEMEEGQTYSFSATVKRHKTYRTKKTTELKKISKVQIV